MECVQVQQRTKYKRSVCSTESTVAPKRIRGPNFSVEEKELLFALVEKHKEILESKRHHQDINRGKMLAWEEITAEFNDRLPAGLFRTTRALKFVHENEKRRLRFLWTESTPIGNGGIDDHNLIVFRDLNSSDVPKIEVHSENEDDIDSDSDALVMEQDVGHEDKKWTNCAPNSLSKTDDKCAQPAHSEKLAMLQIELIEQQLHSVKAEAKAKRRIYELKIRNLELEIRLKEQQLQKPK